MSLYVGKALFERVPTASSELPIESDANYTPARAQGTITDPMMEDYFNAPIEQYNAGQSGGDNYNHQAINSSGEIVVTYPANQWVQGTGTFFTLEATNSMWAACDVFVPTGHDFVKSGKFGIGLYAGNHAHNSGGGGYTAGPPEDGNDDAASVRLHWTVQANGDPTVDMYVYWPEQLSLKKKYGKTVSTSAVIPTGVWQRYIINLDLGTPGSSNGKVQLYTKAVGGSSTFVKSENFLMQLSGKAFDVTRFGFTTFYGGNTSIYTPSTAQTTKFKHFKCGATLDSVDDSPIVGSA